MPPVDRRGGAVSNGAMLTARLYGGLRVWVDHREVPAIPGLRPRSVLAYLLLHPGPHPRVRLAGRFWPDVLDTSARGSLRSALWTVREALEAAGGAAYLAADRTHAGLDPALPRTIDVEEFDRLAASDDPDDLERAVLLAGRPLLADLADEWVLDAQDAHRDRLVTALERLAAAADARGDHVAAAAWTRRAIEHDRLRESLHRDLMRRLDAAGERAQALAAYGRLRDVLGAELGIRPSDETRALARALRGAPAPAAPAPAPAVAVPSGGTLVGRAAEAGALRGAWERARAGEGGVAVLTGAPGMGKTRLLREAAAWAREAGGRVGLGAALDLEGAPPLSPWSEALRELVAATEAPPPEAWVADLARLCPSAEGRWGGVPREPSAAPDLERMRVFEAAAEAVGWCARERPVLLGLEDLHRADPATTALLGFLGRRLAGSCALVVATHREEPRTPHLEAALDAVRGRGLVQAEITLGPMGADDLAGLAAAVAPGIGAAQTRAVVDVAEGNPLLAREAARAAASGARPAEGLRGAVRAPLGRLTPPARGLVALAAVAGRPLEPGEAADLMGPAALAESIAEGVAGGLLALAADRRLGFRHALVREAVEAELEPGERVEAHRRLARALARRPGRRPAEVARHHLLADEPDAAQRHLVEAAQDARALGALDEAAAYLAEAATLAPQDPARVAELTLLLADVHSWRADRAGMDRAFREAEASLIRAGDEDGLALAHAFRGRWLYTTLCFPGEALASSRRALELIERGGLDVPEARALALCAAAWAESVAGDPGAVEPLVAAARRVPGVQEDRGLAAELERAEGMALMRAGDFAGAREVWERAADLARRAGRPDAAALGLLTAAAAAACAGDVARVLALADRAATWPWAGVSLEVQMRAARAHALSRLDRHDEALRAAQENLARAAGAETAVDAALARFDLGVIELAAGLHARAAASIAGALDDPDGVLPRALARLSLVEALAGAGDPAGAARELERVPFEPVGPGDMPEALVPGLSRAQGLVAAARGDAALADRRFAEAEAAWARVAPSAGGDGGYAGVLVDLGRPPVAGLVEPGRELARLAAERRALAASATPG